jgi:corrinoid protein of di/trimethylamine methyltransferase
MNELASKLKEGLLSFNPETFFARVNSALKEGTSPNSVFESLAEALKEIGNKFENGELFLVHLITAGDMAGRAISEILEPLLKAKRKQRKTLGKVVIGTVAGDIHDIGKNIVATMLFSAGFEIIDLGRDVPAEDFVRKADETHADIVAMSALLTTSLDSQREVIKALKDYGIRDRVKVLVGGAPATADWAREIGADGYGADAVEAVRIAKKLLSKAKSVGKQRNRGKQA